MTFREKSVAPSSKTEQKKCQRFGSLKVMSKKEILKEKLSSKLYGMKYVREVPKI